MSIGVVILAAGESSRMGEPKQLLPYRGSPLLQHALDTALELAGPVVVVLGAHAERIRPTLDESQVSVVENADWRAGMGGSLRSGLNVLLTAHTEISAAIFMVCDQPLVTAELLEHLVAAHARTGSPVVASEYGDALGVPALFARALFPELLALAGQAGARQIIHGHRAEAVNIPFPEGAVDLDTPSDLLALSERFTSVPV